jgi:hypothetical protein
MGIWPLKKSPKITNNTRMNMRELQVAIFDRKRGKNRQSWQKIVSIGTTMLAKLRVISEKSDSLESASCGR